MIITEIVDIIAMKSKEIVFIMISINLNKTSSYLLNLRIKSDPVNQLHIIWLVKSYSRNIIFY